MAFTPELRGRLLGASGTLRIIAAVSSGTHLMRMGFGRDFFARLFDEFPDLRSEAVFLRWSVQPDDVNAFFDCPPGFMVSIDPISEYIIVSGATAHGEHGDWGDNDRTQDALDHVREILGTAA
jgi:hypothetical protein